MFRLTQHFYCYYKTLHVSIENEHHQAFLYKVLKINLKCLYLEHISSITTYRLQ